MVKKKTFTQTLVKFKFEFESERRGADMEPNSWRPPRILGATPCDSPYDGEGLAAGNLDSGSNSKRSDARHGKKSEKIHPSTRVAPSRSRVQAACHVNLRRPENIYIYLRSIRLSDQYD